MKNPEKLNYFQKDVDTVDVKLDETAVVEKTEEKEAQKEHKVRKYEKSINSGGKFVKISSINQFSNKKL